MALRVPSARFIHLGVFVNRNSLRIRGGQRPLLFTLRRQKGLLQGMEYLIAGVFKWDQPPKLFLESSAW